MRLCAFSMGCLVGTMVALLTSTTWPAMARPLDPIDYGQYLHWLSRIAIADGRSGVMLFPPQRP